MGHVGGEAIYPSVVAHVASRDGVSEEEARQRVEGTLRWVAAAREDREAKEGEPAPEIPPAREAHLLRAARARLWLDTDFTPKRRAEDIPDDYVPLLRAKKSPKLIHPLLHRLCQVVVLPPTDIPEERERLARDPTWLAKARTRMKTIEKRLQGVIRTDDPRACELMQSMLLAFVQDDGTLRVTVEAKAFHVEACAKEEAGQCVEKLFAQEWREVVGKVTEPGFVPSFETRFGVHLVFVLEVLQPRSIDDPGAEELVRDSVLARWRNEQLEEYIERLRQKRAVRVASPTAPKGPP